jgi:hypothetical protein
MADLMSPKQNFSWHRATPLVAVIAFIGFVVVWSSLAANSVARAKPTHDRSTLSMIIGSTR